MNARPLAQGDSELMAQHQDLGVLPPRLPPGQTQHRHDTGDNEEDQLQAHNPKIIARPPARKPATNRHARALTPWPPRRIRPGSMRFRHPQVLAAQEGQQIGIELVGVGVHEAVRCARVVDFLGVLDELG